MWGIPEEVTVERVHCSELGGRKHEGEGLGGPKVRARGPQDPIARVELAQEPWKASLGSVQTGPRGLLRSLWPYAADGWWQRETVRPRKSEAAFCRQASLCQWSGRSLATAMSIQ